MVSINGFLGIRTLSNSDRNPRGQYGVNQTSGRRLLLAAIGLCVYVSACSGGHISSGTSSSQSQVTISSVTVSPGTETLIAGQTQQLSATAIYSDGSKKDITSTAVWSSGNTAVATVSSGGLVAGVAAGQVTISAVYTGINGSNQLTVDAKALVSIAVAPASATITTGTTQQYAATGTYNDKSTTDVTKSVTWSSSSSAIATIDQNGLATGVSAGNLTIGAAFSGVQASSTLTVNAKVLTSISITPVTDTLYLNSTQQFNAIAQFNDGSAQDITVTALWSSSSASVATVSGSGVVTAAAAGQTSITASSGSLSAAAAVTVSSSNTGVTLIDDLSDSRLMLYWPGDGSIVTYSGTRNSDGTFMAITGVTISTPNQQTEMFNFDSQGRESSALLSDGTQVGFNWTTNPNMVVIPPGQPAGIVPIPTATTPKSSGIISGSCSNQSGLCANSLQNRRTLEGSRPPDGGDVLEPTGQLSTTLVGEEAEVNVTTDLGAGPKPEDNAAVAVQVSYYFDYLGSPAAPIAATLQAPGTGSYFASLPSGPTSLGPSVLQSSAAKAVAAVCQVPIPPPALCGPLAPECAAIAGADSTICKVQGIVQGTVSFLNLLNQLIPPTVSAQVMVDGCGKSQSAKLADQSNGLYVFEAADACKPTKISVNPNPAKVNVSATVPLGASAVYQDSLGNTFPITSSLLSWSWAAGGAIPSLQDNYLQINPIGANTATGWLGGKLGVGLADVVGLSPTPTATPDTVAAVETNSNEDGTSSVTVNGCQTTPPPGTLTSTVTPTTVVLPLPTCDSSGNCSAQGSPMTYTNTSTSQCALNTGLTASMGSTPTIRWQGYYYDVSWNTNCGPTLDAGKSCQFVFSDTASPTTIPGNSTDSTTYTITIEDNASQPSVQVTVTPL